MHHLGGGARYAQPHFSTRTLEQIRRHPADRRQSKARKDAEALPRGRCSCSCECWCATFRWYCRFDPSPSEHDERQARRTRPRGRILPSRLTARPRPPPAPALRSQPQHPPRALPPTWKRRLRYLAVKRPVRLCQALASEIKSRAPSWPAQEHLQ